MTPARRLAVVLDASLVRDALLIGADEPQTPVVKLPKAYIVVLDLVVLLREAAIHVLGLRSRSFWRFARGF